MQCELFHWTEVLNRFDEILASATESTEWMLACDVPNSQDAATVSSQHHYLAPYHLTCFSFDIRMRCCIDSHRCDFGSVMSLRFLQRRQLTREILRFTSLLVEHSFSRHLYNSMDRLIALLSSRHMNIVQSVLSLLYTFR